MADTIAQIQRVDQNACDVQPFDSCRIGTDRGSQADNGDSVNPSIGLLTQIKKHRNRHGREIKLSPIHLYLYMSVTYYLGIATKSFKSESAALPVVLCYEMWRLFQWRGADHGGLSHSGLKLSQRFMKNGRREQ